MPESTSHLTRKPKIDQWLALTLGADPQIPGLGHADSSARSATGCTAAWKGSPRKWHRSRASRPVDRTKGRTPAGLAVTVCWWSFDSSLTRLTR